MRAVYVIIAQDREPTGGGPWCAGVFETKEAAEAHSKQEREWLKKNRDISDRHTIVKAQYHG